MIWRPPSATGTGTLCPYTPLFRSTEGARGRFDVGLADLPAAWSLWTFEVLRQSDEILLVTQMTVPCVRQARRQLDTLNAEGHSDQAGGRSEIGRANV